MIIDDEVTITENKKEVKKIKKTKFHDDLKDINYILNGSFCNFKQNAIKSDEFVLGIDEAGRGPVLGPMVYACAFWRITDEKNINEDYHFDDSKKLDHNTRAKLYRQILNDDRIHYIYEVHSSVEISNKMLRRVGDIINLNQISHESAGGLINKALLDDFNIKNVYADTVGPEEAYSNKLASLCIKKKNIEIRAEKKADSKYKVVSAASIVAKVIRDAIVYNWKFKEDNGVINFSKITGSGYPADEITVKWLKKSFNKIFGYPDFVRFSWKTCLKVLKSDGVIVKFEDYNEFEDPDKVIKFIKDKDDEIKKSEEKTEINISYTDYFEENNLSIFGTCLLA